MLKKILLITVLAFYSLISNSQSRIGFTLSELQKEFKHEPQSIDTMPNGFKILIIHYKNSTIMHIFDKQEIETMCAFMPLDDKTLDAYLDLLNKHEEMIDPYIWMQKIDDVILLTTMKYNQKENKYYFLIHEQDF